MDAKQLTQQDHRRKVTRLWRVGFVMVALALTVATHWPALQLGPEGYSAPDKILHMIAYGTLVLLLAQTRWVTTPA